MINNTSPTLYFSMTIPACKFLISTILKYFQFQPETANTQLLKICFKITKGKLLLSWNPFVSIHILICNFIFFFNFSLPEKFKKFSDVVEIRRKDGKFINEASRRRLCWYRLSMPVTAETKTITTNSYQFSRSITILWILCIEVYTVEILIGYKQTDRSFRCRFCFVMPTATDNRDITSGETGCTI